jgi:hypothetical protein
LSPFVLSLIGSSYIVATEALNWPGSAGEDAPVFQPTPPEIEQEANGSASRFEIVDNLRKLILR